MKKKFLTRAMCALLAILPIMQLASCGGGGKTDGPGGGGGDSKSVELLATGWNNMAIPEDYDKNPYKKYIDETYDMDFTLSVTSDLTQELSKRYASAKSKKPDVVVFYKEDFYTMKQLYNQGFFVEDYTPYLDQVPAWKAAMAEGTNASIKFKENGKLISLVQPADAHTWCFRIREDWVEQFSPTGKNPETIDELLAMAENVQNGLGEGHYLFTSAGENKGFGHLNQFIYMFGDHGSWYVDESGKVNHPILDGTRQKLLDFIKKIWDEGYLDPNYYTQSWGAKRGSLATDKLGLDWYCAEIETELLWSNKDDEENYSGNWTTLYMPTDTPGVTRTAGEQSSFDRIFVINAETAKNKEKMDKILKFLNDTMYPSETYYKLRWGVDIDGYEIGEGKQIEPVLDKETGEETGFYAYFDRRKSGAAKHTSGGLWDYGCFLSNRGDKYIEYLTAQNYVTSAYEFIELYESAVEYSDNHGSKNYAEILNLNVRLENTLEDLQDEFEIAYVRGRNTYSYEEFVNKWKKAGGSTLMEAVNAQFKAAGFIK